MRRARGTVYIMVMAAAILVTLLGLGSLLAVRVERASVELATHATETRLAAQSALSLGLMQVAQDANWRSAQSSGNWMLNKKLGSVTISLTGIDPIDGDLSNVDTDPLVLTGIAQLGRAQHQAEVRLIPVIEPLPALNTCLHAAGLLKINGGKLVTPVHAPLSTNGDLDNDGTIDGDVEVSQVLRNDGVTGTLSVGVVAKPMPDPNVFALYKARATTISMPGNIDKQLLTATTNPWGAANADGVYYIDTEGGNIDITDSRIEGTLLIDAVGQTLTLDNAVFLRSARADYPTLIVRGDLVIQNHSGSEMLSEVVQSTNFNPIGAPYEGQADTDLIDFYPNEVRGLIHVIGNLSLGDTALMRGVVICDGTVVCTDRNRIIHDATLFSAPPEGYTYVSRMEVAPGSYQRIVD